MKYMILGGGGSFGINTAIFLLGQDPNCEVIGVGRNPLRSEPFTLGVDRHPRYRYFARHVTYELDLLLELLDAEQPDVIINFAAQGEGAVSWKHSWRFFETNCVGLTRLVEELSRRPWFYNKGHFIQIGTSELYGSVDVPVNEDFPVHPTSPYAASKLAFDFFLLSYKRVMNCPMTILRPCNAYGPGQLLHRVVPRAIWSGLTGRKLPLQGGGRVKKSYIHTEDLARGIWKAIEHGPSGAVYNLGSERPVSIRDLVAGCAHALGLSFDDLVEEVPGRVSEDACYWLDSSKASSELDWRPLIRLEEGLVRMVAWGQRYKDQIKDIDPTYVMRG